MKCGRQVDGEKVAELGVCPVAENQEYDAVYDGKSRVIFSEIRECEFFQPVKTEEEHSPLGSTQTPLGAQTYIKIKRKQ